MFIKWRIRWSDGENEESDFFRNVAAMSTWADFEHCEEKNKEYSFIFI